MEDSSRAPTQPRCTASSRDVPSARRLALPLVNDTRGGSPIATAGSSPSSVAVSMRSVSASMRARTSSGAVTSLGAAIIIVPMLIIRTRA